MEQSASLVETLSKKREKGHRTLLVGTGTFEEIAKNTINLAEVLRDHFRDVPGLYLTRSRTPYVEGVFCTTFHSIAKYMGSSYSFVICDLSKGIDPNAVCQAVEGVFGGGIILFLIPNSEITSKLDTDHPFLNWIVKTLNHEVNLHVTDILKIMSDLPEYTNINLVGQGLLKQDFTDIQVIPAGISQIPMTLDQAEALKTCSELVKTNQKRLLTVLLANRGRGKSAILGLATVTILQSIKDESNLEDKPYFRKKQAVIIAPYRGNVTVTFDFIKHGIEASGHSAEEISDKKGNFAGLRWLNFEVLFMYPQDFVKSSIIPDLFIADEAAGIPPSYLKIGMRKTIRSLFASTVHGYEGTGRVFSHRFLRKLRGQPEYNLQEVTLESPIRYKAGDFVEKWLFKAFFLDAEPAKNLPKQVEELLIKSELIHVEKDEIFGRYDTDFLRQLVGILVYAHYRNQPRDFQMMIDASHHSIFSLVSNQIDSTPLVCIQTAEEGDFSELEVNKLDNAEEINGHLIPSIVGRYHSLEFAKLKGKRIVRIATHPRILGKGFGSKSINELIRTDEIMHLDWVGVAFGGTSSLIQFWFRLGFFPIHIRPSQNKSTGEHSLVFLLPLTEKTRNLIQRMNQDFLVQLIEISNSIFPSASPEMILELIHSSLPVEEYDFVLTKSAKLRVQRYLRKQLFPQLVFDALCGLTRWHFAGSSKIKISHDLELLLVGQYLQCRKWDELPIEARGKWKDDQGKVRRAFKKIYRAYVESH